MRARSASIASRAAWSTAVSLLMCATHHRGWRVSRTVRRDASVRYGGAARGRRRCGRQALSTETSLPAGLADRLDDLLASVDDVMASRRVPPSRQPVHTVYVPADAFDVDTVGRWGVAALTALRE